MEMNEGTRLRDQSKVSKNESLDLDIIISRPSSQSTLLGRLYRGERQVSDWVGFF